MKTIVEEVIVKDYGRQGLAIFVPRDPATGGRICGYMTYRAYDGEPAGFRPDPASVIYGYAEADMGYFYKGKKPKAENPHVAILLERYRKYAEDCYTEQPCKLVLKRVLRDQQRFRDERWSWKR